MYISRGTKDRIIGIEMKLLCLIVVHLLFIRSALAGPLWDRRGWEQLHGAAMNQMPTSRPRYARVPQNIPPIEANLSTPEFDEDLAAHVTSVVGQTAYLSCRVKELGDRVVSWIRKRDLHILTAAHHVFSSDPRFQLLHPPGSEDWTLKVGPVRRDDDGLYECQVNTEPKLSRAVKLDVKDHDHYDMSYMPRDRPAEPVEEDNPAPKARILGPPEVTMTVGGQVSFTCVVDGPERIVWLRDGRPVSLASGGVSLDSERSDAQTTSKLLLAGVSLPDTGVYSCVPAGNVQPSNVNLVVVPGLHTEAMYHGGYSSATRPTFWRYTAAVIVFLLFATR